MTNLHITEIQHATQHAHTSAHIRLGKREISIGRDFRKRYYAVNPVLDCCTANERGYIEIVLLRKWLIILSKARQA